MSEEKTLISPFEIVPEGEQLDNEKLYLVLLYIEHDEDNVETEKVFRFIKGRQDTYDYLRELLESGENVNILKSRVLVDSPKISISHKCSVFVFMRDMKEKHKVFDTSTFSIYDYKDEEEDYDGKEHQQTEE